MKLEFTGETTRRLKEAGWAPSRILELDGIQESYRSHGQDLPGPALDLLSHFGGLRIPIRHHIAGDEDSFHLDYETALEALDREQVEGYAATIGRRVVPVGEVFSDNAVILMDTEGGAYAVNDDVVLRLGQDPAEMIENLCAGRPLKSI